MSKEAQAASSIGTVNFETQFTRDFVEQSLPPACKRILEVGCGEGELAACLRRRGRSVVAIDCNSEAVASARKRNVDARLATWPDFADELFDAILFTRSLHHIHPLQKAIERVADSLAAGGRLIVEDFAYEEADDESLRWLRGLLEALENDRLLSKDNEMLNGLRAATENVAAWRNRHQTELSTSSAIREAINRVFDDLTVEQVPYYFRYLSHLMVENPDRDTIVRKLAEEEASRIADGEILPLGRRFVTTKGRAGE